MFKKKILILTASPENHLRLRVDKEIKAIEQELDRSKNRDKFEIIPKLAVNPGDLIRVLEAEKPEIVHFSGHGKQAGLVFENEAGQSQLVSAEALARLFKQFRNEIQCVLLNACYSEFQAQAINEHIHYVIGISNQIEDTAAIKFAVGFYASLIAGRTYKDAYDFGCIALDLEGIPDDLIDFKENTQSNLTVPRLPENPPTTHHYLNIINALKSGRLIPFIGPGFNLFDEQLTNQRLSEIELADYLAQNLGITSPYEDLVGAPCPLCLVSADDLPTDCPVKKALLQGTITACPLANEQALALAKMNLQCLAQYVQLTFGIKDVYERLYELLRGKYSPSRFYLFWANLPEKMEEKQYPLPYQLIVTTNYDDMLERAFRAANQPFDLVFYVAEGEEVRGRFKYKPFEEKARPIDKPNQLEVISKAKDRPVILKLYGVVDLIESQQCNFVITEDHHINYLVYREIGQLLPKDILEILWESHNILFMGFNPSDPDLRVIINRIWGERLVGQKSWMIHQSKPGELDKTFWNKRQVELIDSRLEDYCTDLANGIEKLSPKKSLYELWS
ncbi:SIR2 family protein [Nostoc sp. UHCC 0870]|uniref:SIR2 family protein n=1 Tax=Nostoc sp. UHCC 0870 TaxID=2914041 RepID=UPI001EE0393C|nr:SIR2 family protein [Nostoc sp. UHCC 0870]UKO99140.1 SIR2 family protein [Nostoc sp. UHCC 0870]